MNMSSTAPLITVTVPEQLFLQHIRGTHLEHLCRGRMDRKWHTLKLPYVDRQERSFFIPEPLLGLPMRINCAEHYRPYACTVVCGESGGELIPYWRHRDIQMIRPVPVQAWFSTPKTITTVTYSYLDHKIEIAKRFIEPVPDSINDVILRKEVVMIRMAGLQLNDFAPFVNAVSAVLSKAQFRDKNDGRIYYSTGLKEARQ